LVLHIECCPANFIMLVFMANANLRNVFLPDSGDFLLPPENIWDSLSPTTSIKVIDYFKSLIINLSRPMAK